MKKNNLGLLTAILLCCSSFASAEDNVNLVDVETNSQSYSGAAAHGGNPVAGAGVDFNYSPSTVSNYKSPKSQGAGNVGIPVPLGSNVNKFMSNGSGMVQNASPVANFLQGICNTTYYGNRKIEPPIEYETDVSNLLVTSYFDDLDGYINFSANATSRNQVEVMYNFFVDMQKKSVDTKYQCFKSTGFKTTKADIVTVSQMTNDTLEMLNAEYPNHRNVTLVVETGGITFFEDVTSDGTSISGGVSVGGVSNPFGGAAVGYAHNDTVNGSTYNFGATVYILVDVTGSGSDVVGHFIPAEVQKSAAEYQEQLLSKKIMEEKAKLLAKQEVEQVNNATKAVGSAGAR